MYSLQKLGNKDFAHIGKKDYIVFQNWLINENGNSPARVRRIKAAISSLSDYVENILDEDPDYEGFRSQIKKVPSPPNKPVREKSVFSDEELEGLLDQLVERKQYDRACALALGMYSGRRKAEIPRFKVHYFDDSNLVCDNALYKTPELIRTKGAGDGKYIYCYTIAKKFKPYFDLWMKYREENGIESEWLFPLSNQPTEHVKVGTMNNWAKAFSDMLGDSFYWHSMRHYFATSLIRAGIPDGVIAKIVNWESVDMVNIYNDMSADEQISMYFKNGEICVPESKGFNF